MCAACDETCPTTKMATIQSGLSLYDVVSERIAKKKRGTLSYCCAKKKKDDVVEERKKKLRNRGAIDSFMLLSGRVLFAREAGGESRPEGAPRSFYCISLLFANFPLYITGP